MKPTQAQNDYIERVGRWWEVTAGSRNAGRILGWLMICEPTHQSSQALAESLKTSTGSVSTQVRYLETVGLVEKVTFPGDRAAYYQLKPHAWEQVLWSEHQRIKDMHDLALAAQEVIPEQRPDRITGLQRIGEFLIEEWPRLMDRLTEYLKEDGQERQN